VRSAYPRHLLINKGMTNGERDLLPWVVDSVLAILTELPCQVNSVASRDRWFQEN